MGPKAQFAEDGIETAIPLHPLRIKPSGNAYTAIANIKPASGLFSSLPDELIIQSLEYLDGESLLRVGGTCKALFAFTRFEDLWKTLCIESPPSSRSWRGTWRSTYLEILDSCRCNISCENLFSDVLHRPFFCAHIPLKPFANDIPAKNGIARLSNVSYYEFESAWTDKPFILTDLVREWPVFKKWTTRENLLEKYGEVEFRAEAVDWPLKMYAEYMNNNSDESPLYLFDRSFVEKLDIKVGRDREGDYWPPECFGEDLFAVLGDQRPDSRWLIMGPERSGSTFHKDPNATSAWNAVLSGSKYWIMFPPSISGLPPPGVFVSDDQSEVTSPLSIAEWLLAFHAEARKSQGCVEGICQAGEVLYVPSNWWHLVVNLAPGVAITQNFVPKAHLADAIRFLRDKPDQVSGFHDSVKNPYRTFMQKMQQEHPEMLAETLIEMEQARQGRKRKWHELVNGHTNDNLNGDRGFSFGIGSEDEDVP